MSDLEGTVGIQPETSQFIGAAFPQAKPGRAETHFGGLVRELRARAGLTQRRLASAAGLSIGALRDLEQGRTRCPRWTAVDAIAAALGLDQTEHAELARAWSGGPAGEGLRQAGQNAESAVGGAGVRIGVLGPLTARVGDTSVRLGPERQRALLGLLALHGPDGVGRDVIVAMLWGERPPASAVAQVQAYVSQLRRRLRPDARRSAPVGEEAVWLVGRGYQLNNAVGLDLTEFRSLTRRADLAAARGDCRLACALYERSLGMWRGGVLADLDLIQANPATAEVTRQHGQAVMQFARAAAAVGRDERAVPHLRVLCEREPFNEPAHAQLMTALAAAGQQADALRLFGRLRQRLDVELGIRPAPQVSTAHLRILRQQT
jgi:DNA-binding SARP family transcriptional activator/DNA-binding XRE family transcriptional regulator